MFMYAVLWHPKEQKAGETTVPSEKSKIIKEPTWVLAPDDRTVGIIAARGIPEDYLEQLDQIEVLVRPF